MTEIDGYVLYGGKGEGRSNPRPRKGGLSLTAATSKPPGAATSTAICKSRVHDLRSPWIGSSFCLFLLWAELFEVAGFAPWALPSQTRGRWAEPRSNLDPSSIQMNLSSSPILKENNRNKGGRRRRVAVVKQNQLPLNWCGFPPILSSSWHFVLTITRKGGKKSSISSFVLSLNVDFFLEFQTEIQVLELHEWIHYLNQYSFDLLFAMNHLASPYPAIPIDLFGSKKHRSLGHGELVFADSSGNIALRAKRQSSRPSSESRHCKRMLLLDTAGIPLFSFYLDHVSPFSSLIPSTANDLFSRVLNWIAVKVLGKKNILM